MIKCQIIQDGKVKDQIVQMNGLVFCDNHGVERSNSIRTPIVDARLNDIGTKLGYDYQSHFCTAFKRKYGVSPIEYRAMQHAQGTLHKNV